MNITLDQILNDFNQAKFENALRLANQYIAKNNSEEQRLQLIKAAILLRSGATDDAVGLINQLWINKENQTAELFNLKGIAHRSMGKLNEAIEIFAEGFQKYPTSVDLAHNLSLTATDLAQYQKGIEYAKKALALNPKFKETLKNLARIYITTRDVKEAEKIFTQLRDIKEVGLDVLVGEGALDLIANRPNEAAKKFKKALKINPQAGPALANLGICSKFMGDYVSAKKYLQLACEYEPDQIEHPWNLSIIKLALGEYEEGWKEYEVRYDPKRIATDRVLTPNTPVPMLKAVDSVKGKSIVLLQEQGFGDTFQFFRFTEHLKAEGAGEIIAIISKDLMGVIRTIPWIDRVQNEMKMAERLPDYWVFAMSLPYRYRLKTVKDIPYSPQYMKLERSKKDKWDLYFKNYRKKLRIGLIWAGRESHSNDENRSIQLATLRRLAKYQDKIDFFSLQKGDKQFQDPGVEWKIKKLGDELEDFSDTAGVFANLDLLISIDSGPIHLAGAMGMPVWALIPKVFDFRWLIDREDTPWYPSMRLFRQKKGEKWVQVIERLEKELKKFIENHTARWNVSIIESKPNKLSTQVSAGVRFYLESAYQHHLEQQWEQAITMYLMVLRYEPKNMDACRNLASAYRSSGKINEAKCLYQRLESEGVQDSVLYSNYANLLIEENQFTQAYSKVMYALKINPQNQVAQKIKNQIELKLTSQPNTLNNTNWNNQNIESCLKEIWNLTFSNQTIEAKKLLEEQLKNRPTSVELCIMAGIVYQELEEFAIAESYYEKAIQMKKDFPEIYINQAVMYAKQLQYEKAIQAVDHCLQLDTNHAEAHFHKSLYLLTIGEWKKGWEEYEWRMHPMRTAAERVRKPTLSMPMWQGEDLRNKRILLMPEQGYGDYIQFVRYARNLKDMGATVIAGSREALVEILASCPWVDEVAGDGQQVTYHYWTFPMSLPYRLGVDPIHEYTSFPYLFSNKDKIEHWKDWLEKNNVSLKKPIVLLNWTGSQTHIRNQQRNIPMPEFARIVEQKNIQFISINKNSNHEKQLPSFKGNFIDVGLDIKSFSDTAALISLSSLLISVDSAPIHLAGAMGKECWALIDYLPDFRWGLEKKSTNWYPSLTLYRKQNSKNWEGVLTDLIKDLRSRYSK